MLYTIGPPPSRVDYLVDFIYGGSSALLLSLAHIFGDLWFISFFALVPFLWRIFQINSWGGCPFGHNAGHIIRYGHQRKPADLP